MSANSIESMRGVFNQRSRTFVTSRGPIEYAMVGEGPTVMCVHGGPGGYDQGLLLGEIFRSDGFSVLSISRAGYLRSSLDNGRTFEDQADTIAELLDHLGIGRVCMLHASAGGPTGYTFARRHGDRVHAQIAVDSVSMHYTVEVSRVQEAMFLNRFGLWLVDFFSEHFPKSIIKQLLATESTLTAPEIHSRVSEILKHPYRVEYIRVLMHTMSSRYKERKPGLDNDLKLFDEMDKLPMEGIGCPTLIVHGDSDKDVSVAHANYAHESIRGSRIHWIPKGSHLGFWIADTADDVQAAAKGFLREHIS